ncbi:sulfotransferase domain-containing protein [Marinoscillum furvescens]|uniref:Sulfotransferase domain-containing protein n=1 Tax=Marinoscillum furvescens DSM 4134 TaxID=1122208 RepID=A0A3D9L0U8_MARFU|nr:sulfotransferase domain-containing protein [Marinoscillum furvescens]RED96149.1 sulfotransferase domain-containing protein [Marinoscillum furvescens DSM 4134]
MKTSYQFRKYNPIWIGAKAYLWGRSLASLNSDDLIFAFHPKTGSTWVRIFFYNLFRDKSNDFTFDELNQTMPEFGNKSLFKRWPFQNVPRIIKTHQPYRSFFKKNKKILFARDPRDTMYSYLHYANAKKAFGFSGDLKDLVYSQEFGLEQYMRFYQSWVDKAELIIKYEELIADQTETFFKLVQTLELPFSREDVIEAVELSSIEKTRKAQEKSEKYFQYGFDNKFIFARKGQAGDGVAQFSSELNIYYSKLRNQYNFNLYDF